MTAEVKTVITAVDGTSAIMAKVNGQYVELNSQLAQIARQDQANAVLAEAKIRFEGLSQAERDAIVATDDQRRANQELQQSNESVSLSMTEVNSAMAIGERVISATGKAYDATIGKSQAYAQQVREIKAISGQSAEETSRMIQVLDDWQVSAEDVLSSTRKLTANGLAPNIETIAKLSDKYLSLNTVEERNKLVTDNLGVSGKKWNDVLSQGGAALREQAASVEGGLILTEKQLVAAEKLRLSQDKLTDSWNAFSISAGNAAVPALTSSVDYLNASIEKSGVVTTALNFGFDDLFNIVKGGIDATNSAATSTDTLAKKNLEAAQAASAAAIASEKQAAADQAAADAKNALSTANQNFVTLLSSVSSAEKTYTESYAKAQDDRAAIMKHVDDLRAQGYSYYGDTIQGEIQKVREIGQKERELAAERQAHNNEFILAQELQILSVDGLTEKELDAYLKQGKAFGIFTQDYIDKTKNILGAAQDLANGINKTPTHKVITFDIVNHKEVVTDVADAIAAVPSKKTVEIVINTTYSGTPGKSNDIPRASGGNVTQGESYWVGENGPERFIPTQAGTIIPSSKSREYSPIGDNPAQSSAAVGAAGAQVVFNFNATGTFSQPESDIENAFITMLRKAQSDGLLPVGAK